MGPSEGTPTVPVSCRKDVPDRTSPTNRGGRGCGRAIHPSEERNHLCTWWWGEPLVSAPAPTTTPVAVQESKAKEFLSSLRRPKRQLWDRSRPEVQQWYQHFLYLGFDEAVGVLAPSAGGVGPGRVQAGAEAWLPLVGMRVAGQRPGSLGGGWYRGLASYRAEWR